MSRTIHQVVAHRHSSYAEVTSRLKNRLGISRDVPLPRTYTAPWTPELVATAQTYLTYISSHVRVAIIGTAGRDRHEAELLTKDIYDAMVSRAGAIIRDEFQLHEHNVILVSGGAAWADHVAVQLWLNAMDQYGGLTIYLPCQFINGQALDNGKKGSMANPGPRMNQLHQHFGRVIRRNTLVDLVTVTALGATMDTSSNGFHARNSLVARSDYLIAFTWGTDEWIPKEGGTLDTWNKCTGRKVHVPLHTLRPLPAITPPSRDEITSLPLSKKRKTHEDEK